MLIEPGQIQLDKRLLSYYSVDPSTALAHLLMAERNAFNTIPDEILLHPDLHLMASWALRTKQEDHAKKELYFFGVVLTPKQDVPRGAAWMRYGDGSEHRYEGLA